MVTAFYDSQMTSNRFCYMKVTGVFALIAIATFPVCAAVSRVQLQSWLRACDLSKCDFKNCQRSTCRRALTELVKAETRRAYEVLGMGIGSDLNGFRRLYDVCRLQGRDGTTKEPKIVVPHEWTNELVAMKTYREIHGICARAPKFCRSDT
jgi:hypothetical protein